MNVRYRVDLDQPERDALTAMLRGSKHPARKLKRAQILLAADAGLSPTFSEGHTVIGAGMVTAVADASSASRLPTCAVS